MPCRGHIDRKQVFQIDSLANFFYEKKLIWYAIKVDVVGVLVIESSCRIKAHAVLRQQASLARLLSQFLPGRHAGESKIDRNFWQHDGSLQHWGNIRSFQRQKYHVLEFWTKSGCPQWRDLHQAKNSANENCHIKYMCWWLSSRRIVDLFIPLLAIKTSSDLSLVCAQITDRGSREIPKK